MGTEERVIPEKRSGEESEKQEIMRNTRPYFELS